MTHCRYKSLLTALLLFAQAAIAGDNPWSQPIWKSPPLPENPQAAFDRHDPYALAIGTAIRTDCSIRFVWSHDGQLYCFNSLTSKAFFIKNPTRYIREAKAWLKHNPQPQSSDESGG